ncbi:MAG: glycerol kinase, partial [Gammaproteobacteria bacterium]
MSIFPSNNPRNRLEGKVMSAARTILAIDQGTTSTRAMVFTIDGEVVASAQRELTQHFPASGWVEHDPEEIWQSTLDVCRQALRDSGPVAAIGITNQRETSIVWDRQSGAAIYPAIVWQDRRTAPHCAHLKGAGHEALFTRKTGLLLDSYFSATKVAWILDNVAGARERANQGQLAFGTVDSFLIWRLTGGAVHATDATNASRTLMFDIHHQRWDEELLSILDVPSSMLPQVYDCAADFGVTRADILGSSIPILGVAGDQQAAAIGQACFVPGMIKSTYGTGCFALMNTGDQVVQSHHGLLSTVAYRIAGCTSYALEGSIFSAGSSVQWLRDALGIIENAAATEQLARSLDDVDGNRSAGNGGVYLVPAFVGLGAPHWDPNARGAVFGLNRDSGVAHFARAALESVCYQTYDLLQAMAADSAVAVSSLRVDGGMVANDWLLQFLCDILDCPVARPQVLEATAIGAASLAALQLGEHTSLSAMGDHWRHDRTFTVRMSAASRSELLRGWHAAIGSV